MKRIKIKSGNKESVLRALKDYIGDTIILDLEDCKEIYKILSTCPDIDDWDFCDTDTVTVETVGNEDSSRLEETYSNPDVEITGFYDLTIYIEAIWRATKEDNNFGSPGWKKLVESKYVELGGSPNNIERLGLKTILEGYYSQDLDGCIKEMYSRLEGMKQTLPSIPTMTSLTAALFKNKPMH